ncbi:iron complex outermembrane recepter protein [Flagellimonas taeanensis]|jgi:iron complex outermembrane receptor protein|uniref:Iron complex outermembrane recepter protein n=1 Tax=Flagellimonas taeanensis TaxID=1005926 RepID=A0A1M6UUK1_9FLAO|nr:TonB-dependent receptor [Allomuricauda taeanensis]SFC23413.1 iron complex outermembrane recepter protein [Allomuricauda taeanensis]SHK72845.1 iron complex outermembrane recepter protein [Allomuricauda taeanensis]
MKHTILAFLCLTLFSNITHSQISIRGTVTDTDNAPLIGANIILGPGKGATTDLDGKYEVSHVTQGTYEVVVKYIGYQGQTRKLTVSGQEDLLLDFILEPSVEQLQEVEIIGRKEKGYKNTSSFVATKSATKLMDVPQSVGYVTKEVILDQGAFRLNDVVKNISGVNQHSLYNDIVIRGFRIQGQQNSSMMLNGMRIMTSFWKQQLIPHIERVEVLKGPASALFGNASPGGVINSVTKKPLYETKQSISGTVGSFNTFKLLSDFTGPMTKDKKLLYRLNLGYENSDGFRDLQFSKNIVVAPSFSFIPSDRTRLNFDIVYQDSKGRLDRGQAVFGDGDLYSVPISKSLSAANDYLNEQSLNITFSLQHKFTDNLSINSIYLNSGYDEDLLEHRTANAFATLGDGSSDITKVAMRVFLRKRSWNNQNFNNYLNYNFKIGEIDSKLLVGYDYFQQELEPGGSQLEAATYLLQNGTATNSFNPDNIDRYILDENGNPATNVAHFDLTSPTANALRDMSNYIYTLRNYTQYKQVNHGVYVQNQFSYKNFDLLLGLRKEYFTDYLDYNTPDEEKVEQDTFIPRIGAVYKITPNINIYGTWVKGYQPQTATTINNPEAGGPFDPLRSELFEVGFKSEWFQKRLGATLAFYDLTQKGALYNANDSNNSDLLMQIGEEKSKGIELDAYGKIMDNWSLVLNYAYNHAYFTEADEVTLATFGDQKPNAPKHAFNLWTKYVIDQGQFSGLGFGLGYDYVGERNGSIVRDLDLIPVFPSYGLVNTALYYTVDKFQIQLNFNNVFDKTHWVGGYDFLRAFPGQPRNIMTTVSYTF